MMFNNMINACSIVHLVCLFMKTHQDNCCDLLRRYRYIGKTWISVQYISLSLVIRRHVFMILWLRLHGPGCQSSR